MNFVLILITRAAFILPNSVNVIPFDSMESCEIAFREVKKEWAVVDRESKCVDLKKSQRILKAQAELNKAMNGK